MVITKNQIRPRRIKVHFTNAEILLLDTTSYIKVVREPAVGQTLLLNAVQVRTTLFAAYTNIDVNAEIYVSDDFNGLTPYSDVSGSLVQNFTELMTPIGLNIGSMFGPYGKIDDTGTVFNVFPQFVNPWTDETDLFTNGAISFVLQNGGSSDLTGGDPRNFMDVFIDYSIVNLDI